MITFGVLQSALFLSRATAQPGFDTGNHCWRGPSDRSSEAACSASVRQPSAPTHTGGGRRRVSAPGSVGPSS
uniref:Putative secreted mucin n=1 Tax=Amblyomma cajennense TaxID=34607 RepID=A0A023FBJ8_AMBCJ